jgi:DNA-binding LacI/PurR family transcriptional regulator
MQYENQKRLINILFPISSTPFYSQSTSSIEAIVPLTGAYVFATSCDGSEKHKVVADLSKFGCM